MSEDADAGSRRPSSTSDGSSTRADERSRVRSTHSDPDVRGGSDFHELRDLLTADTQARVGDLDDDVAELRRRLSDGDEIADTLRPRLGTLIKQSIVESREDMIEALYPIIGSLIARSVREAIADLSRTLEAQRRRAFDVRRLLWRARTSLGGASAAEIALREALPFAVRRVLLIHRETGILVANVTSDGGLDHDADMMGAMLTALRDFATDTLDSQDESLDTIEVGDQRVLVEANQRAVLAVEIEGTEPPGYREVLRERLTIIDAEYGADLREFDGSVDRFSSATVPLNELISVGGESQNKTAKDRGNRLPLLLGLSGVAALLACNLFWTARLSYGLIASTLFPTPEPTPTRQVLTPTPQPTPTRLPSQTPTARPTPTPTPSPPVGRMTGTVYLQTEGGAGAERTGSVVNVGDTVNILESKPVGDVSSSGWYRIRSTESDGTTNDGWVPSRYVERLQD